MDTGELLERLKEMAIADENLRKRLLATKGSETALSDFCKISTEAGVPLNKMDMIEFGESSYAAMRRSTNGGGENAPLLQWEDDAYEMFMMELEMIVEARKNITLVGMPASGKSTVGVILAKILGMNFIDTDLVIQQRENALLYDIIKDRGVDGFLAVEEESILSINPSNTVIATGGSAIYSKAGMEYLKNIGKVVYLKVDKEDLFRRLHNIKQRGVVLQPGETLDEMYESRSALYEKYADIVIDETDSTVEETVEIIQMSI